MVCFQSFDKQGFHAGTPPPFNLPSAMGGPGGAPGGYAPAPFLHILQPAHQQPHSQMLHHHLAQDGQVTHSPIVYNLVLTCHTTTLVRSVVGNPTLCL